MLISGGVDTKLMKYRLINDKWVLEKGKKKHSHDILALAIGTVNGNELVVSGGVDTVLVHENVNSSPTKGFPFFKSYPFPNYPLFSLSKHCRFLLTHSSTNLQLWKLGRGSFLTPFANFLFLYRYPPFLTSIFLFAPKISNSLHSVDLIPFFPLPLRSSLSFIAFIFLILLFPPS